MLGLLFRIPFYILFRWIGFPRLMPINYTISLCYRCNSRCKTCNIYEKKAEELTLDEYKKLFDSIGHSPYWVTFSGGEPFLRKDLPDVVHAFYIRCHPKIINIPSNGILTQRIVPMVEQICEICPRSQIIINLSIDAIGDEHDEIRGISGNYEQVIRTFQKLKALKVNNLSVGIHTVISRFNVEKFSGIANRLLGYSPDSYITEIAEERVELDTVGTHITPKLLDYRSAVDFLIHRIKNGRFTRVSRITQAFRVEYYNLVKRILRDQTQVIPCYAGYASVQISPDGEVWPCCIKAESAGNVRDHGLKFRPVWFSREMNHLRRSIRKKECHCPMANASYTNMMMHIPTLLRVFYRSFMRWWV